MDLVSIDSPLTLFRVSVDPHWVDYNNHLTESRYLYVFSEATDEFYKLIGVDDSYRKSGFSYFTVETHMIHKKEVKESELVYITTDLRGVDDKKIHILHQMYLDGSGDLLAVCEQILFHVDLKKRSSCSASIEVIERLNRIYSVHSAVLHPDRQDDLRLNFNVKSKPRGTL